MVVHHVPLVREKATGIPFRRGTGYLEASPEIYRSGIAACLDRPGLTAVQAAAGSNSRQGNGIPHGPRPCDGGLWKTIVVL